jgi:hypothetical protein
MTTTTMTTAENKANKGNQSKKTLILECALKGTSLCENPNCNGIERSCDKAMNHSSK